MANPDEAMDADERQAVLQEYATLREEILKRIDLRQQIVALTLTIAAVFLGVGLGTSSVALIYPVLAALLALAWQHNDIRTRRLAEYIRERHETRINGLRWETYCQENGRDWRPAILSYGGIFVITQLMAVVIGIFGFTATVPEFMLLASDALSTLYVIRLFWMSSK